MSISGLDLQSLLLWERGLPLPQWDIVEDWIGDNIPIDQHYEVWNDVARQWLAELASAIDPAYEVCESNNFIAVVPRGKDLGTKLLRFAERARTRLMQVLFDLADFATPGKELVIMLRDQQEYDRYVAVASRNDEVTSSVGMHLRDVYPHIALNCFDLDSSENILAHEMTHAALHRLTMPQWIEEGLAQMFEHDMTGRQMLMVDGHLAKSHKAHWDSDTIQEFWHGHGFHRTDEIQSLNYQLAEILIRLLFQDFQPRWFGWDRTPQQKLATFLRTAKVHDCGARACRRELGFELGELPARFLGPGDWDPVLE